ncbi:MAG: hypothetical protein Q9227_002174 [Pyrenula ochraceoflavens]
MPKSGTPPSLNLGSPRKGKISETGQPLSPSTLSPGSPRSIYSAPGSPMNEKTTVRAVTDTEVLPEPEQESREEPTDPSSPITAIPQYPPSPPKTSPKHGRDPSKSFFSNLMASKSSHRLHSPERNGNHVEKQSNSRASSRDRVPYTNPKARGSTPDLPRAGQRRHGSETRYQASQQEDHSFISPDNSSTHLHENIHGNASSKRGKPRFGGLLKRSQSIRTDENARPKAPSPKPLQIDTANTNQNVNTQYPEPLKTAPLHASRERAFKEVSNAATRNRSADRYPSSHAENVGPPRKDNRSGSAMGISSSFKDGAGAQLLSNLQLTSKGAADRIGKAGKGIFGKITRSGSSTERELVPEENYTCTVINMPLVQQTRRTRIAKRLELSKDKTEFWMPALPWRCIDYLNMNGCEEEGLYRVPGSGKDVKHWQKRFDLGMLSGTVVLAGLTMHPEYDINLFDEPDLYDINTIGSMFKAWLRDLPDTILPKAVQAKVAEQCMGATSTPQLLKDELSNLPPFNYYLLFAITCHLSLLNSFSAKNKMNYNNLCVCFQPCLKIDAFCFQFLVNDWKNCWQGCWTEKEYLEEEYRWQTETSVGNEMSAAEERAISSSDSGQQAPSTVSTTQSNQPPKSHRRMNGSRSTSQSKISIEQARPQPSHAKSESQLPELGPPLSPIKI